MFVDTHDEDILLIVTCDSLAGTLKSSNFYITSFRTWALIV